MILTVAVLSVLLLASLAFVARPLIGGRRMVRREEDRRGLLTEREMNFELLRDLQHDHLTGKIDEEDFDGQKAAAEARAIAAMRRLDALGHMNGGDPIEMMIRQERLRLERGAR